MICNGSKEQFPVLVFQFNFKLIRQVLSIDSENNFQFAVRLGIVTDLDGVSKEEPLPIHALHLIAGKFSLLCPAFVSIQIVLYR